MPSEVIEKGSCRLLGFCFAVWAKFHRAAWFVQRRIALKALRFLRIFGRIGNAETFVDRARVYINFWF
jgi:hypothetical protein